MKFFTIALIFSTFINVKLIEIQNSTLIFNQNPRNVAKEIIDLLNDVIQNVNHPLKKLDYIQTGISLIELLESNLIVNSSYEKILILFETLNTMNERSKFGCDKLNQDYRIELTNKTKNLLKSFEKYAKKQNLTENSIKNICKDNEYGVNGLFKLFRRLLEKNEVSLFFKECCIYDSIKIVKWFDMIREYSFVFITLVRACEYENLHKSDFDSYLFIEDINVLLRYHATYTLLDEFVNDKGSHGLRKSVLDVLNENLTAIETSNRLKLNYSFYDWDVIFYSNKTTGSENHFAYYSSQNVHCGSLWFSNDELNISKNALVSWCSPHLNEVANMTEQLISINMRFNISNPFENSNIDILILKNVKNLVEVLIGYPDNIIKGLNYLLCTKDNQLNKNYSMIHILNYLSYSKNFTDITCYASFRIENNCKMPQPALTQTAIYFPDLELNFHMKFEPYYKNLDARSPDQCWSYCKNESKKCVASSYKVKYDAILNLQSYRKVCFLHEENFTSKQEFNWIGYSQTVVGQNRPILNINLKLTNPFKQFYSRSISSCWFECLKDPFCVAASFAKPDYYWYILPTQQCYLLVMPRCFLHSAGYGALKEIGWVSYTKEVLTFSHPNLKFVKHYKELSNINDSNLCWEKCKKEIKCAGSSFGINNCLFFDETSKFTKELGWISHTTNKLSIVKSDIKLKYDYKSLYSVSDYFCMQECLNQTNCIAISFSNSTCLLFEMKNHSVQITKESGWISFFPAFENIRSANHYLFSTNENTAFECFEKCLNDTKCTGSSFWKNNNEKNSNECYFFQDDYESKLESGFITYFKNIDRKLENFTMIYN